VLTVVTFDDVSLRALAVRNADLGMSVTVNSCSSDACNSTLGRTSESGHFETQSEAASMPVYRSGPPDELTFGTLRSS
jgi:hypothetical protein